MFLANLLIKFSNGAFSFSQDGDKVSLTVDMSQSCVTLPDNVTVADSSPVATPQVVNPLNPADFPPITQHEEVAPRPQKQAPSIPPREVEIDDTDVAPTAPAIPAPAVEERILNSVEEATALLASDHFVQAERDDGSVYVGSTPPAIIPPHIAALMRYAQQQQQAATPAPAPEVQVHNEAPAAPVSQTYGTPPAATQAVQQTQAAQHTGAIPAAPIAAGTGYTAAPAAPQPVGQANSTPVPASVLNQAPQSEQTRIEGATAFLAGGSPITAQQGQGANPQQAAGNLMAAATNIL